MSISDPLTQAIDQTDLPALVAHLWPESGAIPGRPGLYRAVWRGDKSPSLSLFRKGGNGIWLWRDFSTGQSGNALHLLQVAAGMSRAEAASFLKGFTVGATLSERRVEHKGVARVLSPISEEQLRKLQHSQQRLTREALKGRGITLAQAREVGLGESPYGLIIPILGADGSIQAIKCRLKQPRNHRYVYLTPGRGVPPWFSPGFGLEPGRPVLVVEGELNGIACWFSLDRRWDVIGVAGVEGDVPVISGRPVHVLADGDTAGQAWAGSWSNARILPPLPDGLDACEYADKYGLARLGHYICGNSCD
jgi:putative DNA primase/helicase